MKKQFFKMKKHVDKISKWNKKYCVQEKRVKNV